FQPAGTERRAESPPLHAMKTAMLEMQAATDFAETAWIYTRAMPTQTVDNGEAALQVRRAGARYEIDADVRSGCRIVISEVAWPGWRAYLDGRRVKLDRANHAFLAVYVPEGRHRLRVVYLPDAFVIGRAISFATLLLLAIAAIVIRARRGSTR
ncbi:MAG TPA: YfhO family protein, partial [Thermoanaerobaculia bacterium]|nr:YfhO family protein [Thermoanaerobaculia bacterium]